MAKQHFQHAHVNQKGSMGNQKPSREQPKKTGSMDSKTMEKTKHIKTQISQPIDNQNNQKTKKEKTTTTTTTTTTTNISLSIIVNPNH